MTPREAGPASLYDVLRGSWNPAPDRAFLTVPGGRAWTYGEIDAESQAMAAGLAAAGATPGSRVVVQVDKSPYAVALYLATLRTGATYVPINPGLTATELAYLIEDAEPVVFVGRDDASAPSGFAGSFVTLASDGRRSLQTGAGSSVGPRPGSGGDVVAMLYTSGTTGRSKGAMLTSDNLVSNATALYDIWRWAPDDVLLHALPIFHTHGLFVALHCAILGASEVVFLDSFNVSRVLDELPRSTVMMGVPTHYHRLLGSRRLGETSTTAMRLFTSGSAPLSTQAHRAFHEATGHMILERYGMTEAGMITSNPYPVADRIAGSVGFALPGVDVRVRDADGGAPARPGVMGGVEVKGPNVFAGYWRDTAKTREAFTDDGYLRTGDIGSIDEAGRLSLAGRAVDLIITGGSNVYPREVEATLELIAGIDEAAIVGIDHPDYGEAVVAVYVGSASETDVAAECRTRLADYKRPKRYVRVDGLPRNAMGKVQKQELRNRLADLFS